MKKTDKDVLTWYIRQLLHLEKDIDILSDDGIIHLVVKGRDYYLYIKSLTYAGNPYPLNTTRAQLPEREEFNEIKKTECVFLFLGYDEENEVFACWDPIRTKERLNEKKYVSFFSRLNLQKSVIQGNVVSASLQNDFKYVLFNINDLAFFLLNIRDFFPDLVQETVIEAISEKSQGVLLKVEDDSSVKLLIDELYRNDANISTLSVISECMNTHGEFYFKMTLKDWHKIVKTYISRNCPNSLDGYENELQEDFENETCKVAETTDYHNGEEDILIQDRSGMNNSRIDGVIFSHPIDWSPFEYGFTIDKKFHDSIFKAVGRYIQRGTGVLVKISFDNILFDAKITNANCQGRKGDTIRLLYNSKKNNLGSHLKTVVPEIYTFISNFKDMYGGRKQCTLPSNLHKLLVFRSADEADTFIMDILDVYQ